MSGRTFAIVDAFTSSGHVKSDAHNFRGTYTGQPLSAAKKAGAFLCRQSSIHGVCTLYITIREKTRGSAHKVFRYKVVRHKLATPIVIIRNGLPIAYHYKTTVKAVPSSKISKRTWPDPRIA